MIARTIAAAAVAFAIPAASLAATRPVVLELFTSQGCSSCPPADELLTTLASRGDDVLPLAFHVTYWDSLGWKDPFSLKEATEFQNLYASRFGDSPYTPELVVDGRRGMVGSQRSEVESAILTAEAHEITAAPVSATQQNGIIGVTVGAGQGQGHVVLIGYDPHHKTTIGRGENAGRTLVDSNAVRSFEIIGTWAGTAATFTVKAPVGEQSAVLLLTNDGDVIGAARTDARS
jgi:hypothetical protein